VRMAITPDRIPNQTAVDVPIVPDSTARLGIGQPTCLTNLADPPPRSAWSWPRIPPPPNRPPPPPATAGNDLVEARVIEEVRESLDVAAPRAACRGRHRYAPCPPEILTFMSKMTYG
jgi:hypothetical protein